jgi:tRNA 5-methylaminomethyl-2-thiouridine biosynthesis bifunctional protein
VEGQAASALAEARGLLLGGCGLLDEAAQPAVWRGAARWAVLETGFGHDGLHFFATWAAWRQQAQRPARLFYTAVMATPPEAQALIGSAARFADLAPRAAELAAQWHGLVPGVHRLRLDGGRVQLTLAIGDVQPLLTDITGEYDSIFLDRFEPDSDWGSLHTLKSVARLARHGTRVAAAYGDDALRERLAACGFNVEADTDPQALRATYAPRWTPRSRRAAPSSVPGLPAPRWPARWRSAAGRSPCSTAPRPPQAPAGCPPGWWPRTCRPTTGRCRA